ncbi:hypothetical protein SCLCIDRAFT_1191699, partial [Scleroderma citrinum Foug A]
MLMSMFTTLLLVLSPFSPLHLVSPHSSPSSRPFAILKVLVSLPHQCSYCPTDRNHDGLYCTSPLVQPCQLHCPRA